MNHKLTYLTQASIVTPESVLPASSLLIEAGRIIAINPESAPAGCQEFNLQDAYLMPGLIDLHGDGVERVIEPRPGVIFPIDYALRSLDSQLLSAGITTVYHALSFAGKELGVRNAEFAAQIIRRIDELKDVLDVDTRSHCRYEVTSYEVMPVLREIIEEGIVHQLSFMDHTPGQGQFMTDESYFNYLVKAYKHSPEAANQFITEKKEKRKQAKQYADELLTLAHQHNIVLASHDDDSVANIERIQRDGFRISEFPLDLETARAAKEAGLFTTFGSPNVVRGKSQSNGMRALDAIEANVASCLCSDYMHSAMLTAIFKLFEDEALSLPEAVKLGTFNPAQALGDHDLGAIALGRRANLISVRWDGSHPRVESAWVDGLCRFKK